MTNSSAIYNVPNWISDEYQVSSEGTLTFNVPLNCQYFQIVEAAAMVNDEEFDVPNPAIYTRYEIRQSSTSDSYATLYNTGIGYDFFELAIVLAEGTAFTSFSMNYVLAPVDKNLFFNVTNFRTNPSFGLYTSMGSVKDIILTPFIAQFFVKIRYWSALPPKFNFDSQGNVNIDIQAVNGSSVSSIPVNITQVSGNSVSQVNGNLGNLPVFDNSTFHKVDN